MPELERDLATLAAELDWPQTPDLVTPTLRRVRGRAPRRRRPWLVIAVAALAIGVPATAVAFDWFGLRDVEVRRVPAPPRAEDPELGTRLPLAQAARRAGVTPLVPPALAGAAAYETGGRLSLRGGGLLLQQRRGGLDRALLQKIVAVGGDIERLRVGGSPALWFPTPHAYLWVTPRGDVNEEPPARSGPALVWERGGRVLRLEGARLTRARALAIAEAARPAP